MAMVCLGVRELLLNFLLQYSYGSALIKLVRVFSVYCVLLVFLSVLDGESDYTPLTSRIFEHSLSIRRLYKVKYASLNPAI
jgi:hypothetical protein